MGKLIDTDELTRALFHKHEMVKKQFTFPDNDYAKGIIMGLGIAEATAYDLPDIVHCRDCIYRIKEWRGDKRMKETGYWVYGCEHFAELMGYWGWGGNDNDYCSYGERRESDDEH